MAGSEIRNRKKSAKKSAKKIDENKSNEEQPPQELVPPPQEAEETILSVLLSHPLIKVLLPLLVASYVLYRLFFFLLLQHPEYLGGILRPAVRVTDERQVLIVGSLSSGTVQTTAALHDDLHLEVVHETSDAMWHFARDGTVSWFHGVRFIPRPPDRTIFDFCMNHKAKGFHPTMYRASSNCNIRDEWSNCWAAECISLLDQEWGCGLDNSMTCETPFRKTLHQVRHPLRTLESLVADPNVCIKNGGGVRPSFLRNMKPIVTSLEETDTCIEAAAKYVLTYNRALLSARAKGHIDAMFQIELATACKLAQLAGLTTIKTVVYKPNYNKISSICDLPFPPEKEVIITPTNQLNTGDDKMVALNWADLRGGMHGSKRRDDDLETAMRELTIDLGYMIEISPGSTENDEFSAERSYASVMHS